MNNKLIRVVSFLVCPMIRVKSWMTPGDALRVRRELKTSEMSNAPLGMDILPQKNVIC